MVVFDQLFQMEGLTPHGYCLLCDPALIWLHLVADGAIAIAYLAIPAALATVGLRRPDLNPLGILYWFAAFIILCAATHVAGIVTLWRPWYVIAGAIKLACAVVSVVTATLIWRVLRFVLVSPSHADMATANRELRDLNEDLEGRVAERTAELSASNERLVAAVHRVLEADRVKADFMARMSHELRTPMNAIIGFSEMLLAGIGGTLRDRQREYCESIHDASVQLLDQINNVLALERHGDPMAAPEPKLIGLAGRCEDVVDRLQAASRGAGVDVVLDIPPDLSVMADSKDLTAILSNLISNAIKYSPSGSRVVVKAEAGGDGVTIRVSDRGFGVDPTKADRVFEPFFRAHERELPSIGGAGLGLSLVKMMVDAHGGRVEFQSRRSEGTTVTIWLPNAARGSSGGGASGGGAGVLGPPATGGNAPDPMRAQP